MFDKIDDSSEKFVVVTNSLNSVVLGIPISL